jgi:putative transposase
LSAKLRFLHAGPVRSRYRINDPHAAYFVTATVVSWLPVFTSRARCDILVESLEYCRKNKGLEIFAWVILDNHLHAILSAGELPQVLADFKRHTARSLVEHLEKERCEWLLNQLEYFRSKHKAESRHQVWQEGSHPQQIASDEMLEQKMDYIHHNPVKRGLVAAPEHWRYSSAHAWCEGAEPLMRCDEWSLG